MPSNGDLGHQMLSKAMRQNCGNIKRVPRASLFAASACVLLMAPVIARAQDAGMKAAVEAASGVAQADPSINYNFDASESEGELTNRRFVTWNEYEGPYFTARLGGGLLYDYAGYDQNSESEKQLNLDPKLDLRDFRFVLKGQIKFV